MTSEQKYFLQVISDYVCGRTSAAPREDVQLEKVAEIAAKQSLGGIVFAQCKGFLPKRSEAYLLLERHFSASVFRYVTNNLDLAELKSKFAAEGIEMVSFKGLDIAKHHRIPELRTMGDIDMLIHKSDRKKTDKLMHSLGFECIRTGDSVWTYKRDVVKVEIHERMIYESLSNDFDYAQYFDCAWEFAEDGSLNPDMQFLFLIVHTAKHIMNRGSGFRPFLDMMFMADSAELDWQFIRAELEKIKLLKFAEASFALCSRWFGFKPPFDCGKISEEFFNDASEKTFADGIFGFDNKENFGAHMAKSMKQKEKLGWLGVLVVMLRKLFPKENSMQHLKVYSFLFRHKLLRPVAWIFRVFYCAATRLRDSVKLLLYPLTKRKEIEKRNAFLGNWGL